MRHEHEEARVAAEMNRREVRARRVGWGLLAAGLAVFGYVVFDPELPDRRLEAGNRAPVTQPAPPPAQTPGELAGPPEPPAAFPSPDPAPPEEPPYVGPRAPEFTGSPAPPGLGLVDGVLFGRQVLGMHPELLRRLREVEETAALTSGSAASSAAEEASGVEMIVAYRAGSRTHSQGRAVDINYYANPYVMHESGEEELNARLGPVYHRIARMMVGRDSVIPDAITQGAPDPARTLRLYRALRDESRGMVAYFRLMQDRDALLRFLESRQSAPDAARTAREAESTHRQMLQDYVTLSGRAGPPVPGMDYPEPETGGGDPPFAGDPTYRGPELGFINLREELMIALTAAGLRWGGTDMGSSSGDLMHFYLPASLLPASYGPAPRGIAPVLGWRGSGNNRAGGNGK